MKRHTVPLSVAKAASSLLFFLLGQQRIYNKLLSALSHVFWVLCVEPIISTKIKPFALL